jgi:maltose-binding protein MalE
MKKLIVSILLLSLIACGKGGTLNPISANSCEKTAAEYEKVLNAWSKDPSNKANCEAFKKALTEIIKDCSVYTSIQRKAYEDQLKQLTCD